MKPVDVSQSGSVLPPVCYDYPMGRLFHHLLFRLLHGGVSSQIDDWLEETWDREEDETR